MLKFEKTIWTPDNSDLLRYRAEAETGKIIIGRELWMELDNLAEDMKTGEYIYNTDDARLRMDFMENCIRLTKSPFYNQPMKLMLWQRALIEAFYSFKMAEESINREMWIDRFKRLLLLIARKNFKSETSSALCTSELIVGNPGSDIVASSNDDAQASIVYDAIDTMRQLIDPKDQDTRRNQRFIISKESKTKIFKLSDRTRNKEGRNIDFAVVDEIHEMKDNVIGKSIEQSQSLKDNPKMILITTEGFLPKGYLSAELEKARAIIRGEATGDAARRFLPWLYTQDSESEVWEGNRVNRLWMKSNPTLGVGKRWDYMEEQVDLARESKADRIFVLSKDFNIKQNSNAESWLNLEDFNYPCAFDLEEFRGAIAIGAVDLSETTDLTAAKVMMLKKDDPKKYIISHYFIPQSKLEESDDKTAGAHYKEWAAQGILSITEGNDIDLAVVADWFYSLYKNHGIRLWRCGYDQRFAKDWINRMSFYGWEKTGGDDSDLIMILQNAQTLSNAIRLAEAEFKHKLIYYNNNEMDRWCFGNACIKVDDHGQALIVKSDQKKRIDGAVAICVLFEVYRRFRSDFTTISEKAGAAKD